MFKYQFKTKKEITGCYDCPMLNMDFENGYSCNHPKLSTYKNINDRYGRTKPKWCPLEKVEV